MATYTPNYNLSKPEANDDFDAFRASYGDNMDKIDQNMGGGGGGGHTIVDPTGTEMPQESKLQFTGAVNVSDDSANGQTVVNVEGGGNVYGAFIDPTRVVYSSFVFDSSAHTWTATEDCILTDNMLPPDSTTAYFIRIGGKQVFAGYSTVEDPFVYVKKGQVVEYRAKSGSSLKAYGVTQGTNGIFAPVIYSDTERAIGVWRDGKPLYQKTILVTSIVSGNNTINHGISNVDKIVNTFGTFFSNANNSSPIPNGNLQTAWSVSMFDFGTTNFTISVGSSWVRYFDYIQVTIQYTKTTDVAGSGSWTPSGVKAVHYSTNEQVIGTWINGKPLYAVSISLTSGITVGSYGHVTLPADSVVRDLFGVIYRNSYKSVDKFNGYINNGDIFCSIRSGNLEYYISNIFSGIEELDFTVQYTKTTD